MKVVWRSLFTYLAQNPGIMLCYGKSTDEVINRYHLKGHTDMGVNSIQNYGNEMTEKAVRICRAYLPGSWKMITGKDVEVSRISGGLSNWLYHVKLTNRGVRDSADTYPREVLLRLYGQSHGECGIQHLVTESVIFALLSERKLGPKLYGVFTGGRIEEYVPARPLNVMELKDKKISLLIAEKMAAIHALNFPLSKDPTWLWDTITRWLKDIGDVNMLPHDNIKLKNLLKKRDLYSELKWLRSYLSKLQSPVVFCHNDMQEGNILIRCDRNKDDVVEKDVTPTSLMIIDYEYCAYNYRGFDIANHFIEWDFDYKVTEYPYYKLLPNNYPTLQEQTTFINYYLKMFGSEEDLQSVIDEVRHFTLASHLFWVIWSLVNGKMSKITFGYWEYGADRLQMYYALKSQLLGNGGGSPNGNVIGIRNSETGVKTFNGNNALSVMSSEKIYRASSF